MKKTDTTINEADAPSNAFSTLLNTHRKGIADQKAKEAAQAKAEALAAKKAAAAPDKAKLLKIAEQIEEIQVPAMLSNESHAIRLELDDRLDALAHWLKTQAATL